MKIEHQLESLQNAADSIGATIHEKLFEDKRKKVPMFFANIGNETISPVLNYNDMNNFLHGWIRAKIYTGNNKNTNHGSNA